MSDNQVNADSQWYIPRYKQKQILRDAGAVGAQRYRAFPTVLKVSDSTVIIVYKNGEFHLKDRDAPVEAIWYDAASERIERIGDIDHTPSVINQNPELLRMPNGDIVLYIDAIYSGLSENRTKRMGLRVFRSTDGGNTFVDEGEFPIVNEYGYGYAFDDYVDGETVYLLIMSFPELAGETKAVHAIRTDDNGRTWTYIRNLNDEFNFNFNESSLERYGNSFLVIGRGYDRLTRLFKTDMQFRMFAENNLSETCGFIDFVGRPKLFQQDGRYYLLCRNVINEIGYLQLYRVNPETLTLESNMLLDECGCWYGDSYYAEHYFQEKDGELIFNVITYLPKTCTEMPDIVRLEYRWDELK